MREPFRKGTLLVVLVTVAMAALFLMVAVLTAAVSGETVNSLERPLEPVIVPGSAVAALTNTPTDELFVYVYQTSNWIQIPFQIDEIGANGRYTTTEDSLFDTNDEIVMMAPDLGGQPPAQEFITAALPIGSMWYELEVIDPLDTTQKGWAYLVQSSILDSTFVTDYVHFDLTNHRLTGSGYSLGFDTPNLWADYLSLGTSSVDILDRSKFRLFCSIPLLCPVTEEDLPIMLPDDLIKDGPVRVIVRNGRVLGYDSMVSWTTGITIPQAFYGDVRFSLDFDAAATGATLYNATTPGGVTIDGIADTVPAQPVSTWLQYSSNDGTMIQVADLSQPGGLLSNYYEDDNSFNMADTGDQMRYGEAGTYIASPDTFILYQFNLYFISGNQPNLGDEFEMYFQQPLQTNPTLFAIEQPTIYLPFVLK